MRGLTAEPITVYCTRMIMGKALATKRMTASLCENPKLVSATSAVMKNPDA